MPLHRNTYSFVYRGEDCPDSTDVIWIHHDKKNDLSSPIVAEIWIRNEWRPFLWGAGADSTAECCCCGSPFVRDEGKSSAVMRAASAVARGEYSFAAGNKTAALADRSIAIGHGVVADYEGEVVLGKYNERSGPYKFVVGVGESDAERKNAIIVSDTNEVIFYNNLDDKYYSLGQIIQSIGRGEIVQEDFILSGRTVEIVPDV